MNSERIQELKRQKGAVILAHYYTSAEVQEVADFLGDSLALSIKAKEIDAPIILFAGVNFMAETAKVLCPDKKVLIPVPEAGCSLAESCDAKDFAEFKKKYPGHKVVSYVKHIGRSQGPYGCLLHIDQCIEGRPKHPCRRADNLRS